MQIKQIQKKEKGQSLVELALMITFILILLAGVVDLGRMMYEYLTMRDAAQEGAGYGAIFPDYCEETIRRVQDNLPDNNYQVLLTVDGSPCTGTYIQNLGCAGEPLMVEVKHNFAVTMPLLGAIVDPQGDGVPMNVIIEDRIVRPEC